MYLSFQQEDIAMLQITDPPNLRSYYRNGSGCSPFYYPENGTQFMTWAQAEAFLATGQVPGIDVKKASQAGMIDYRNELDFFSTYIHPLDQTRFATRGEALLYKNFLQLPLQTHRIAEYSLA